MAKLMQRERLLDRRGLAHHVDRAVDGFLCQLQRERVLRRSFRRLHHEGKFGRGTTIDHAEPVRFLRAPDVGGEQQFLGLARAELPGMHEPFDAADAHGHTGSQNSASLLATIRSQAQASIRPPAMHLPCTSAMGWPDCASAV